jgi:hypothetical protein
MRYYVWEVIGLLSDAQYPKTWHQITRLSCTLASSWQRMTAHTTSNLVHHFLLRLDLTHASRPSRSREYSTVEKKFEKPCRGCLLFPDSPTQILRLLFASGAVRTWERAYINGLFNILYRIQNCIDPQELNVTSEPR